MRSTILRTVPVAGLLVVALAAPANATSGTLYISGDTTLTEDQYGSIVIAADNVTLDCAGFSVIGSGVGQGIRLEGRTGVTVRNCSVRGFLDGIMLVGSDHNTLRANVAERNTSIGIDVISSSDSNSLFGNTARSNDTGLNMDSSSGNVITNNRFVDNVPEWGVFLDNSSDNNRFFGNIARGNGFEGFTIAFESSGNQLLGNTSEKNSAEGISLYYGADGNLVNGNVVSSNANSGVLVYQSSHNSIKGNSASDNGGNGFQLKEASAQNTLEKNLATGNRLAGFILDQANGNQLTGNVARGNGLDEGYSGFDLYPGTSNNVLRGNLSMRNGDNGFYVSGATDNVFDGNQAISNPGNGFAVLDGSDGNVVNGNLVTKNANSGVLVDQSSHNTITDNRSTLNNTNLLDSGAGISVVDGSSFNDILRNVACKNGVIDAYDDHTGTANTWEANQFCTSDI